MQILLTLLCYLASTGHTRRVQVVSENELLGGRRQNLEHSHGDKDDSSQKASFSKDEFRAFPVLEVREAGPGTKVIKCQLPSDEHIMGMKVSSMVMVKGSEVEEGIASTRPYTPITTDDQAGYFELLVKGYPNGVVSKYLCSLEAGDMIQVKGPFPKLQYVANMRQHLGMIAGGSGITPMLQVIKEIMKNPDDKTNVTLVFCNQSPRDILLRSELDELAVSSNGQLSVVYVVDRNDVNDPNIRHVGYVTKDFLASVLPAPSAESLIYVCGPPPMLIAVAGNKIFETGMPPAQGEVDGFLKELGYTSDMVYKF